MDTKHFKVVEQDRIFNDEVLEPFFELGNQPPANTLRPDLDSNVFEAPLTLAWGEKSKSVQLTVNVDSEYLFKDYVWVTGTSQVAKEYAEIFADRLVSRVEKENPFVVEIASNDGTFLKPLKARGCKVVGVDPAANIAKVANDEGVETVADFFNESSAGTVIEKYGQSDVVFARNVIPHVEHIDDVLKGVVKMLKDDGTGCFEFHYAGKILNELHYDSIYHEHLFYFSLASMTNLLEKYGFHAYDLTISPISGGSYVLYFSRDKKEQTEALKNAFVEEDKTGINDKESWLDFARRSEKHGAELKALMEKEKAEGRTVVGYGASARSSTMLNFCNIDNNYISCIADKSSYKHDKFTAGTNIKILAPEKALETKPDTILLLAWNFEEEIINELKEKYNFSGRVIVPLPDPIRVLEI